MLAAAAAGPAGAETIELITYYPAPGGAGSTFDRAHANRMTVGDAYNRTNVPDANVPDGYFFVSQRVGIGPGFNAAAPARRLHVFVPDAGPGGNGDGIQIAGVAPGLWLVGQASPAGGITAQRGGFGMASIAGNYGVGTVPGDVSLFSQVGRLHLSTTPTEGTNPTVRMTVDTAGNVGIGTTAPANKLMVVGPWTGGPGGTQVRIHSSGNGYPTGISGLGLTSQNGTREWIMARYDNAGGDGRAANSFAIGINGVGNFIDITPAGKVGIGAPNPAQRLHVYEPAVNVWTANIQGNTHGLYASGSSYGLYGQSNTYGVTGYSPAVAVYGYNSTYGVQGSLGNYSYGVYGYSPYTAVLGYNSSYGGWSMLGYYNIGIYAYAPYYTALFSNGAGYTTYVNWYYWGLYTNGYIYGNWASSADFKKKITPLSAREEASILSRIESLPLVHYLYKMDKDERTPRLGVTAESLPQDVRSEDGKGVEPSAYVAYSLAGVKALAARVKRQEEEIQQLKGQLQQMQREKTKR